MPEPRRKEVEIEYNGEKVVVVLKELTWGEYNDLLEKSTSIQYQGMTPIPVFNLKQYREYLLLYSIEKAPFGKTIEEIRKLPASVAERLYREAEKLNPLLATVGSGE